MPYGTLARELDIYVQDSGANASISANTSKLAFQFGMQEGNLLHAENDGLSADD